MRAALCHAPGGDLTMTLSLQCLPGSLRHPGLSACGPGIWDFALLAQERCRCLHQHTMWEDRYTLERPDPGQTGHGSRTPIPDNLAPELGNAAIIVSS